MLHPQASIFLFLGLGGRRPASRAPGVGMRLAVDSAQPLLGVGSMHPGPEHASHLGAQPHCSPHRKPAATVPALPPPPQS